MAETAPTLDLSQAPQRARVILPDGVDAEIRAPEEFTTEQFKALSQQFRAISKSEADSDDTLDAIDELLRQIFVEPPDLGHLTIGHKHRIVDFFSRLGGAAVQTPTSSPSPEPSDSSEAA